MHKVAEGYTSMVVRKFKGQEYWLPILMEEAVYEIEKSGQWRDGVVRNMLESGMTLWTSMAHYKVVHERK